MRAANDNEVPVSLRLRRRIAYLAFKFDLSMEEAMERWVNGALDAEMRAN